MGVNLKKIIWVTVALLILVGLRPAIGHGLTLDSARDCDDNAVINCGALNFTELQNRYSNAGVAQIYQSFGISAQDINNISNTAVEGVVTKNNNVWINRSSGLCPDIDTSALSSQNQTALQNNPNLCLVATDAMTAGRQNIAGSTVATSGGVTFYRRPPSVSFVSSSLSAFVVMQNGRFVFAIIASCGNPVVATPTPTVTPKPLPAATVRPSETPTQTQTQSQNVNITTPTTTTTPTATPAVQAAVTTAPATVLPNTGAGDVISIFGGTTILGTVGHWFYMRRKII